MTDKHFDVSKLNDETLAKIGETIDSERERRGQHTGPDPAHMTDYEFERFKNETISRAERATRAREAANQLRKAILK